jgi:hypothetical protein
MMRRFHDAPDVIADDAGLLAKVRRPRFRTADDGFLTTLTAFFCRRTAPFVAHGLYRIGVTAIMKHKGRLAVFAACAVVAFAGRPTAVELLTPKAYADGVRSGKVRHKREGSRRVRGYYSYGRRDVLASHAWVNRAFTPMYDLQSSAGPFDSGFFFDSGLRPHWWNNAPYPN